MRSERVRSVRERVRERGGRYTSDTMRKSGSVRGRLRESEES